MITHRKQWVRAISDRRAAEARIYRKRRLQFLAGKRCARCGGIVSDVHHSRGRAGSLYLDDRFWIALCRACHDRVNREPNWARSVGLLCERGLWNKPGKME